MADAQKAESTPSPDTEGVLRTALEEIANPIAAMQRRADAEGAHLIGHQAQALSNDADYLKGIARAALAALSSPPVSTVDEEGGGA